MSPRALVGRFIARRRFRGIAPIVSHSLRFAGHVAGTIDACRDGVVMGWVYDAFRPQDILDLEVLVDGELVATGRADQHRDDLAALLGDRGLHGFIIEAETLLWPIHAGSTVSVRLKDIPAYVIGPVEVVVAAAQKPVEFRSPGEGPAGPIHDARGSSFSGVGRFTPRRLSDATEERLFQDRLEQAIRRNEET